MLFKCVWNEMLSAFESNRIESVRTRSINHKKDPLVGWQKGKWNINTFCSLLQININCDENLMNLQEHFCTIIVIHSDGEEIMWSIRPYRVENKNLIYLKQNLLMLFFFLWYLIFFLVLMTTNCSYDYLFRLFGIKAFS